MSQVGSPPTTARPAPTAPAVTGAAVTPTPTDQATGNAPRHHGGGQPAPQQQQPPQAPPPPAPAVTLAGALTALFSGQPTKATVEGAANGQMVLRLPEAQLVIAAAAIEAARGDVLVLKLAASEPNPAVIVTARNGRPVTDPTPVPVTIEPVAEPPPVLAPPISRRPALSTAIPLLPGVGTLPVPIAGPSPVPHPAGSSEPVSPQPQILPTKVPIATPSTPAAPPVLIEADLPPVPAEAPVRGGAPVLPGAPARRAPSLLLQVTQPLRAAAPAPVAMPAPQIATATPSSVHVAVEPLPLRQSGLPLTPQPPAMRAPVSAISLSQFQAQAEPDAAALARSPVATAVPIKTEDEAATTRLPPPREHSQPAPNVMAPPPVRRTAEGPVPFVPPAIPPEALRPPVPQPPVAMRMLTSNPATSAPVQNPTRPPPEPAKVAHEHRPAAAAPATPANPAAPSAPTTPAMLPELVPIEVEPPPPPDAPLDRRAASAWAALWATARLDPVAAERIRDMLQPKAGGRLGGGLAFLVSALRGGKLAEWLGAEDSARIDRPSRPVGLRTVEAEFRDLARMAQERGPDGWRATPLAVLDGGAVQPVMLYVHRPPRRRKNDPSPGEASERFMLDLKLSRAGPMRIDGLLRPKALDVIVRTERSVPARIQRDLRQVFTTSLDGAGLGGTLAFQKVDRLPPPPAMAADGKPHHAVLA